MNEVEKLKESLAFMRDKRSAEGLTSVFISIITAMHETYSCGVITLALCATLGKSIAAAKPDDVSADEWFSTAERVMKQCYDTALEDIRNGERG